MRNLKQWQVLEICSLHNIFSPRGQIFVLCTYLVKNLYESQYFSLQEGMFCSRAAHQPEPGPHAAACVVINHAVTPRLSGLSTTLSAWCPGTSGDVWGDHGTFVCQGQRPDVSPQSHMPPTLPSLPPGSLQTQRGHKVYTLITWHITLWGTVNRGRRCLGAAHQWQ